MHVQRESLDQEHISIAIWSFVEEMMRPFLTSSYPSSVPFFFCRDSNPTAGNQIANP